MASTSPVMHTSSRARLMASKRRRGISGGFSDIVLGHRVRQDRWRACIYRSSASTSAWSSARARSTSSTGVGSSGGQTGQRAKGCKRASMALYREGWADSDPSQPGCRQARLRPACFAGAEASVALPGRHPIPGAGLGEQQVGQGGDAAHGAMLQRQAEQGVGAGEDLQVGAKALAQAAGMLGVG